MTFYRFLTLFVVVILTTACSIAAAPNTPVVTTEPTGVGSQTIEGNVVLTVMTHDSFAISEDVVSQFEADNQVKLRFLPSGDAGSAINRAILSKENPLADVFYGVDNTFLSRVLEADLFDPYQPAELVNVPSEYQLDPQSRVVPVNYGDVCINYDRAYFQEKNLAVPETLEDLVKPEYKGLLVVENPSVSSPGLAFMLSTIAHFGQDGYLAYWKALVENGVVVVNDWETAYYTNFSGSSGQGPQPMVVSYGSSPAAEVYFAETALDEAPTASIVGPDMCFRQIEFIGILKGTKNRELAEKFIDAMLSTTFQEDLPLQMFVFPVNKNAKLPDVFVKHVDIPQQTAQLDYETISKNRESWINGWVDTVLR